MNKKRAMTAARWAEITDEFIAEMTKRLETGYAEHQPKWPYWVAPLNYSEEAWLDMNVWMIDTFGSCHWGIPNGRWVGSDRKYWFRDAADRTFFILRWS